MPELRTLDQNNGFTYVHPMQFGLQCNYFTKSANCLFVEKVKCLLVHMLVPSGNLPVSLLKPTRKWLKLQLIIIIICYIYIALFWVLKALYIEGGDLLNHHQCAASTWMMRRQPYCARTPTTHQLQVERTIHRLAARDWLQKGVRPIDPPWKNAQLCSRKICLQPGTKRGFALYS